jgi:hypothetical protein
VHFTVTLKACAFTDQDLIRHEFIKRLHGRCEREGIEIAPPIGMAYSKDAHRVSGVQRRPL